MDEKEFPRLELEKPWTGGRIPARIEQGRLCSQCGQVAPTVPVYLVYLREDKDDADGLVDRLRRAGHRNIVMEGV